MEWCVPLQALEALCRLFHDPVPAVLLAAVALRIEFHGLLGLVSDLDSPTQERAWVLMPNVSEPDAAWMPAALRTTMPHFARMVVKDGKVVDPGGLPRRSFSADGPDSAAYSLAEHELAMGSAPPGHFVNTKRDSNLKVRDLINLAFLAPMEKLAELMRSDGSAPGLGGVSQGLLTGEVPEVARGPARIASRVVMTHGTLSCGDLWTTGEEEQSIHFQLNAGPRSMFKTFEQPLARYLVLDAELPGEARFEVRSLQAPQAAPRSLVIAPDEDDRITLLIKNSEADEPPGDRVVHFVAHFLIRDGWETVSHARFPDTSDGGGPAGLDPQCTPGDNGGGR